MKYVYLITVDDHYGDVEYHLCATEAAADKLFKKLVEKYFDSEKDTEEDFKEACYDWYWQSQNKDTIMVSKHQVLTEDEI